VPLGIENPAGDAFGDFRFEASFEEREFLMGEFESSWTTADPRDEGIFSLTYDPLYERASSLALLAGTYTAGTDTLTIDDQGAIFYQSAANDCAGSGAAELIDPEFNLYRLRVVFGGCSRDDAVRNGATYSGLAYLSDSGDAVTNDVLQLAASAFLPSGCPWICFGPWRLVAHK
jgi:hypothetical protein